MCKTFMSIKAQELSYRHITVAEGLPSMETYQIKQDQRGYIWVATDRGICLFDGSNLRSFDYQDGLSEIVMFGMAEAPDGKMWFHGINNCLYSYSNGSFSPHPENKLLSGLDTRLFLTLNFNNSLTGVASGCSRLIRFNDSTAEVSPPIQGDITRIYLNNGALSYQASEMRKISKTLQIFSEGKNIHELSLKDETGLNFHAILSSTGDIYFVNNTILTRVQKNGEIEKYNLEKFATMSLYEDNETNIWIGLSNGGALVFQNGILSQKPYGYLKDHSVSSIFQDHEDRYWFSTLDAGVFYQRSKSIFRINEKSLPDSFVETLATSPRDQLLIGLKNGDIVQINRGEKRITAQTIDHLPTHVEDLAFTADGSSIYHSWNGYYDDSTKAFEFIYSKAVLILKKSGFLIAKGGQIIKVVNDTLRSKAWVNATWILKMLSVNDSLVLMGTSNGLYRLNLNTFKTEHIPSQLLDGIRINDIVWLGEGKILIGTHAKGLIQISLNDFGNIKEETQLSACKTQCMLMDKAGGLWVGTQTGLQKWAKDIKLKLLFTLKSSDGLNSDRINDLALINDTLWVATDFGLNFFESDISVAKPAKPIIDISKISVNGEDIEKSSITKLRYTQNNIGVEVKLISYLHPNKLQFEYQLSPRDTQWYSSTSNRLDIVSLGSGKHKLKIRSGISDRIESLDFEIAKPYWTRWWFVLTVLTLLVLILYYAFEIVQKQRLKESQNLLVKQKLHIANMENKLGKERERSLWKEKKQIEENLESQKKELTALALNISAKSNIIEAIGKSLKAKDQSETDRINSALRWLRNERQTQRDWNKFNQMFTKAHPEFEKRIFEKHPSLSSNEYRLIMLICLKMNSTEISNIQGVNAQSVNKARYRLRKKLGLMPDLTLEDYLFSFRKV